MKKEKLSAILGIASLAVGGAKLVLDHFNENTKMQEAATKAVQEVLKASK